jgi:hypothetical protein
VEARNMALGRVLEMVDATLDGELPPSAKKELSTTREIIVEWFSGNRDIECSPKLLEEYFTQFAYLK